MKLLEEFKAFIQRGNVIDLAVAVIIGGAFAKIVSSLVDNVLMPLLGIATASGINISTLSVKIQDAELKYGSFLQAIIDFVIISFCVFLMVKAVNALQKLKDKDNQIDATPELNTQEKLLTEIRDLLKARP